MSDKRKTKAQLIEELQELREKVAELEAECESVRENASARRLTAAQKTPDDIRERLFELESQNRELKRGNEQLRETLAHYAEFYDAAPLGCLAVDRDGIILMANHAAGMMLDRDRDQLLNQCLLDYLVDEERDGFREQLSTNASPATGSVARYRLAIPVEAPARTCLLGGAVGDSQEDKIFFVILAETFPTGIGVEPESRVGVSTLLEREKLESEALLAAFGDPIGIMTNDFKVLYQNFAHRRLFGQRLGQHCYTIFEDQEQVCEECPLALALADGLVHHAEKTLCLQGKTIHADITASPIINGQGRIVAGMVGLRDISRRKRAEEALAQSDIRYRQLFHNMSNGVVILQAVDNGEDFIFIDLNRAAEQMERVSREALLGKTVLDKFPDFKKHGLLEIMRNVWHTGEPARHPVTVRWGDWIQSTREYYVYRLPTNEIVMVYEDVTKNKRAEHALKEQHKQLKTVLEATPDLIALKDTELNYILVNKAFCNFFGKKEEEIIGHSDYALFPPKEATAYIYHDSRVITRGRPIIRYEEVTCSNGGRRWLQIEKNPFFNDVDGRCLGLLYTVRDITSQRRAEEALRESEERYKRLVEGSPDILYIYSHRRGFIFWSARIQEILGYSPDALRANPFLWHESIHPDDRDEVSRAIAGTADGEGFDLQYRIQDAGGDEHWFHDRHIDIIKKEGDVIIEGLASDITERKAIEEELKTSYEQLEDAVAERTNELLQSYQLLLHAEKLSSLGKLAASIAHEFGSPIFGIRNFLRGLPQRASLNKTDLKLIDLAVRECDRIKELIDGLRGFKRPSSSTAALTDIHALTDDILLLCQRNFRKKNIQLIKSYGQDVPRIWVVEDQIKQVILNLLDNAEEAIPAQGGKIIIETKVSDDMLVLSIEDTGKGMDEETLTVLFEPFVSTKNESGGIGLGMSISSEIIAAHGGEIKTKSEPDQGTMFTILLPIEKSESIACGWGE